MRDMELEDKQRQIEELESELMPPSSLPEFEPKTKKAAIKVMKPIAKLFDIDNVDEQFDKTVELITASVNDAVEAMALPDEFTLTIPTDDSELDVFSGILYALKGRYLKMFNKWLQEPREATEDSDMMSTTDEEPDELEQAIMAKYQ